jgi:hypothetical protein
VSLYWVIKRLFFSTPVKSVIGYKFIENIVNSQSERLFGKGLLVVARLICMRESQERNEDSGG